MLLSGLAAGSASASGQDLLSGGEVLELTLAAPLDELSADAADEDYNVVGRATYMDPVAEALTGNFDWRIPLLPRRHLPM